jgi:hypothetical protein
MKRIFLLLLVFVLLFSVSVFADPQTKVLTPSNWQDVFQKIQVGYIRAIGGSLTTLSANSETQFNTVQGNTIYLIYTPSTAVLLNKTGYPVATISQGIYILAFYGDSSGMQYAYLYDVTGLRTYGKLGTGSYAYYFKFNITIYYARLFYAPNDKVIETVQKILYDWQGRGGGVTAWLLFNVSGNMPVSYTIKEGSNTVTLSYGGGSPIYMFYMGTTLPLNVTGAGLNQLFPAGAYLIQGSNWYKANYSTTNPTNNTNNTSSNMATLTVTVKPSTYTIQFLLQGALAKQGNGTLSYQFPKNTTVTIRILNGATELYKIDYKLTQDMSLFFNFGNDNSLWNPSQVGSLTLQFYEADPVSGYLRGQIVVDSVQLIGLNNSVTRTANGVSQITFTNLPYGHYQIIAQKSGYFETRVWIFFNQSQRTIRIGMLKKANNENIGTDKPLSPTDFVGTDNFNGTNVNALARARNQTRPTPTVSGNFYGFHFIITDSQGNLVNSAQVQILAVKSINKVLWQDTVTYPLAVVNVINGSAYWYITQEDLDKALQYAGFWESFGGFKVVVGSNSMFVPSQFAYNRFYELRIVSNQGMFGNTDVQYQGNLFGSTQVAQLIGLLMPLIILSMIFGILKDALKNKK